MISRRSFLGTAGCLIFAESLHAQPTKTWRIGYLAPGLPDDQLLFHAFREGLRALGYTEGRNVTIDYRSAEGRLDALSRLAEELVKRRVDVIVAPTTPAARAAKAATGSIPIVFTIVSDPIGSGLVASLSHPGGNVTGISDMDVDLAGKRLDLLQQVVPRLKRVGAVGYPADRVWAPEWKEVQAAARSLRLDIVPVLITKPTDFETVFADLNRRADALMIAPQTFFGVHRQRLLDLISAAKLPSIHERRALPEAGALMSYGPNYPALLRKTAGHVDKILKGAKPAALPVEQPTEYELVINLKTAKALGLAILESVLARADEVDSVTGAGG